MGMRVPHMTPACLRDATRDKEHSLVTLEVGTHEKCGRKRDARHSCQQMDVMSRALPLSSGRAQMESHVVYGVSLHVDRGPGTSAHAGCNLLTFQLL